MQKWGTRSSEFKRLWNYSLGFYAVWVAHIGRKFGLFSEIAKAPVNTDLLAERTGLYRPAVEAWCTAALSAGYLKERKMKFYLTKKMKSLLLDPENSEYIAGQFSYLALRSLDFGQLEDLFRSHKTNSRLSYPEGVDAATAWDHYAFLSAIRKDKKLHLMLSKGAKILDVGCGTGQLLKKMLEAYPSSFFVGIEPSPDSFAKAKKMSDEYTKSIMVFQKGAEFLDFNNEFDLVYLGESLYVMEDKRKVLSNCHYSLKKGGIIAIVEGLLPESKNELVKNENKLISAMQLDFTLQGHNFMTRLKLKQLLKEAGFSKVKLTDLGGAVFMVTAAKSKNGEE